MIHFWTVIALSRDTDIITEMFTRYSNHKSSWDCFDSLTVNIQNKAWWYIHLEPNQRLKFPSKSIIIRCPALILTLLSTSTQTWAALRCYYLLLQADYAAGTCLTGVPLVLWLIRTGTGDNAITDRLGESRREPRAVRGRHYFIWNVTKWSHLQQ